MFGTIGTMITLSTIKNMSQADKNDAKSEALNLKAFNRVATAENELYNQKYKTSQAIEKLASRKKAILSTSFKEFLNLYEQLMKINFTESDGMRELDVLSINSASFGEVQDLVLFASKELSSSQLITTMVFKGGISGIVKKESEINLSEAKMRNSYSCVIESQSQTNCVILSGINQRANQIADLLAKLNVLFVKSLLTSRQLIQTRGLDKANYTKEDRECLATCLNLAHALKEIIDSPLLNEHGELEQASQRAIETGNEYLNKMHCILNS